MELKYATTFKKTIKIPPVPGFLLRGPGRHIVWNWLCGHALWRVALHAPGETCPGKTTRFVYIIYTIHPFLVTQEERGAILKYLVFFAGPRRGSDKNTGKPEEEKEKEKDEQESPNFKREEKIVDEGVVVPLHSQEDD